MSDVKGLRADSAFINLLGELPIAVLLAYVHDAWHAFATTYEKTAPSFQQRDEPQLTKALTAYLRQKQDAGHQAFTGDFYGELSEYVLDGAGLPKCIARTDIEWRLHGVPALVIEFKILDGKPPKRDRYLHEGVMRFVTGRYGGSGSVGAMFALLREAALGDPDLLQSELERNAARLQCAGIVKRSKLLPEKAAFDTSHNRTEPYATPFHLAHIFVPLPL